MKCCTNEEAAEISDRGGSLRMSLSNQERFNKFNPKTKNEHVLLYVLICHVDLQNLEQKFAGFGSKMHREGALRVDNRLGG